ncbi:hypothetical protein BLNAU_14145 [Blattamonas nauphoetae]|uniref:Uncharacterized protein n=1 Tax=Blattamonas nauphoetae TaxID=2049346 RepID=A0ABQ9XHP3_9EUKA|nr:hypothetical protein BLNAU_14145 [Blattamonas nauphoetae]
MGSIQSLFTRLTNAFKPFLRWNGRNLGFVKKFAPILRSLVKMLKEGNVLDDEQQRKAVRLLNLLNDPHLINRIDLSLELYPNSSDIDQTFVDHLWVIITCPYMTMAETGLLNRAIYLGTASGIHDLRHRDVEESDAAIRDTILNNVIVPSSRYVEHVFRQLVRIPKLDHNGYLTMLILHLFRIAPCHLPTLQYLLSSSVLQALPSVLFEGSNPFAEDMILHELSSVLAYTVLNDQRTMNRFHTLSSLHPLPTVPFSPALHPHCRWNCGDWATFIPKKDDSMEGRDVCLGHHSFADSSPIALVPCPSSPLPPTISDSIELSLKRNLQFGASERQKKIDASQSVEMAYLSC